MCAILKRSTQYIGSKMNSNNDLNDQKDQNNEKKLNDKPIKKKKRAQNQSEPSKKRKKVKKWSKNLVVDKNKLTMFDLLSYNPPAVDDLLKQPNDDDDDDDKTKDKTSELIDDDERPPNEIELPVDQLNGDDQNKSDLDDNEETIGPRVKINENGEIVLDEASLVVKRKKPKDNSIKTVYEDDKTLSTRTNYSSFKKPGKILIRVFFQSKITIMKKF